VVERDLAKVDVAGSTPVSRSKYPEKPILEGFFPSAGTPVAWNGLFSRITLV
jgi:hypothetical protein